MSLAELREITRESGLGLAGFRICGCLMGYVEHRAGLARLVWHRCHHPLGGGACGAGASPGHSSSA